MSLPFTGERSSRVAFGLDQKGRRAGCIFLFETSNSSCSTQPSASGLCLELLREHFYMEVVLSHQKITTVNWTFLPQDSSFLSRPVAVRTTLYPTWSFIKSFLSLSPLPPIQSLGHTEACGPLLSPVLPSLSFCTCQLITWHLNSVPGLFICLPA